MDFFYFNSLFNVFRDKTIYWSRIFIWFIYILVSLSFSVVNSKNYRRMEEVIFMYIENIVIGKPIVETSTMFATNENDWERIEKEKTYYTEERFLPRILVDIGIYPSVNEIRRNKPELMIPLDKLDFIDNLKASKSKKRRLWILVGE